ncbi:MAG: hypothetical protein ACW99E_23555 [Promethearchaeota archaeon]
MYCQDSAFRCRLYYGGIAILFGNLAPECAEFKASALSSRMRRLKGMARVFDSGDDALKAILGGTILIQEL